MPSYAQNLYLVTAHNRMKQSCRIMPLLTPAGFKVIESLKDFEARPLNRITGILGHTPLNECMCSIQMYIYIFLFLLFCLLLLQKDGKSKVITFI